MTVPDQLIGQQPAVVLEDAEGVDRAAAGVKGADTPVPHRLPKRVGFDQVKRVGGGIVGAADTDECVKASHRRSGSQLLETNCFGTGELLVRELGVRRASPQSERLVKQVQRLDRRDAACLVDECFESPRVDRVDR